MDALGYLGSSARLRRSGSAGTAPLTRSVWRVGSEMAILRHRGLWKTELVDVVRAASGGLLFGIPMLFTVEVTWTGQHTGPRQALAVLAVSFVLLTVLNRTAGFRGTEDRSLRLAVADAGGGSCTGHRPGACDAGIAR